MRWLTLLLLVLLTTGCVSSEREDHQEVAPTACVETPTQSVGAEDDLEARLIGTWDQCYAQRNVDHPAFAICDFQPGGVLRQIERVSPDDPHAEPRIDLYDYRIVGQQVEVRVANRDSAFGAWATLERVDSQTAFIEGFPQDSEVHWRRVTCTGFGFDE